jgi:hypothetical protein
VKDLREISLCGYEKVLQIEWIQDCDNHQMKYFNYPSKYFYISMMIILAVRVLILEVSLVI